MEGQPAPVAKTWGLLKERSRATLVANIDCLGGPTSTGAAIIFQVKCSERSPQKSTQFAGM